MSLKNLVNKARKSKVKGVPKGKKNSIKTFATLDYNLNLLTPEPEEIIRILEGLIGLIKNDGSQLTTETKNALILATYRLALSQDRRATGCFHPSEISTQDKMCHRKMYFQKGSVRRDVTYVNFTSDNRMMRLVDLGTLLHLYVQENLDRLGVLKGFEVPINSEKYGVSGHMDGVVEFCGEDDYGNYYDPEDMALEIKSISTYGFNSLRGPKKPHKKQASIYGHFLGYKRICFLYYDKNNSALKIYIEEVDEPYVNSFKLLASSVIKDYNAKVRSHRTTDVSKHTNIPKKICKSRTTERAMECEFADYCFKHRSD